MSDPTASTSTGASPATSAPPTADVQPGRTPGTRLLKDVEAEENRVLYDALYKSLDTAADEEVSDDLKIGDTVRGARQAKKEFLDAVSKPMTAKAKDLGALYQQLGDKRNAQVLSRFLLASVLMVTVPLMTLMVGMNVVAPRLGVDDVMCGGFAAVTSTIIIGGGYVIYAFIEDSAPRQTAPIRAAEVSSEGKAKKEN